MKTKATRLEHFPVSFFAVILGMTGLTIVAQRAEKFLHVPLEVSGIYLAVTGTLFLVILSTFLLKTIRHPQMVRKEFYHPIKINFFPASTISLLLLSIASLKYSHEIARYLWLLGASGHLLFTLSILSIWLRHDRFNVNHKNPAWFIPIVGNIIVPVAGVDLFPKEFSWFFFSVGFILWVVLFTIFMYRAFFHQPLPEKLLPTFFILIAPPAIGFIAFFKLTGEVDAFGKVLYFFALFLTFLLFFNVRMFARIKFYLSWWAYSFPLAAISLASIVMYHVSELAFFKYLSFVLIGLLNVLILFLAVRTIRGMLNRAICIEED